jgi:hypothetical protein
MTYKESKSICSRSRSKRKFKAGRKIGRYPPWKHQPNKIKVSHQHNHNYSPLYKQEVKDRLFYSDEHKPNIEHQE